MDGPLSFLTHPGFQRGVLVGAVAAVVAWVVAFVARRRIAPAPVAGLAFAGAAVVGVSWVEQPSVWLVRGLGALLAGWLAGTALRLPHAFRPVLAVPGAMLIAWPAIPFAPTWVRASIAAAIVVGGAAAGDLDRRHATHAVGVPMLAATVLGVYATVPDTEEAVILLGAMVPVAILGFPLAVARLGSAGAVTAIGMIAWVVGHGGRARETAIVGGIACLGMFLAEPSSRVLSRAERVPGSSLGSSSVLLAAHLAIVAVASRVLGVGDRLDIAVAGAIVVALAGVVLAWLLGMRREPFVAIGGSS